MSEKPAIMNTKDELLRAIKEWLKNDNEIKVLQKEIRARKTKNDAISKILIETMKENEIDRFDMNNGKIVFSRRNVKKPISQKLLLDLLTKYYKNDTNIAKELTEFIISNREQTTREIIVHKPPRASLPKVEPAGDDN